MPLAQAPRPAAINRWVATLNNYTNEEYEQLIQGLPTICSYGIIGREVGESGTPHLQCFFIFLQRKRLNSVKAIPGLQRAHLEPARGTSSQASTYCKKEGDYWEHGSIPGPGPKVPLSVRFRDWFKEQPGIVTERDILDNWPQVIHNHHLVGACYRVYGKRPTLVEGDLRPWQRELEELIESEPDDRKINFVVDPAGNNGKSWLTRYLYSNRDDVQMLSVGKRDDLNYAIDVSKRVFVFDIPRQQMEYFQYAVVEAIKNQMVMSNKYKSEVKIIPHKVHVIVFSNESPDMNAMTGDRYNLIHI